MTGNNNNNNNAVLLLIIMNEWINKQPLLINRLK